MEAPLDIGKLAMHPASVQAHFVLPGDLPEVPKGDPAVTTGHLRKRVAEPLDAAGQLRLPAVARNSKLLSRLQ